MKAITARQPTLSKRFAAKTVKKGATAISARRVVTFKVSRLTKPWALKGTESVIRALSGSALDGVDVRVQINDAKPVVRKRTVVHA